MIRFFDIVIAAASLILLLPLFLVITLVIALDSRGGVFFTQIRTGKNGKDFRLIKFRSMVNGAEKNGDLTVGERDKRITTAGYFLRKFKIDELPQLINVLKGDMSMVGPRPELRHYTDLYTEEQKIVLSVRPGITDYASIEYFNENDILGRSSDPERTFIEEIMPAKIALNKRFIQNRKASEYFRILWLTALKLFKNS